MTRTAGILLHATSLPGPHGTGDLGNGARAFVEFLAAAGQGVWQFLPVNPAGVGGSPYSGASAFAGDPMLISLVDLVDEGWLTATELPPEIPAARTDHQAARELRDVHLRRAFTRFRPGREYERFEREAARWLDDHALFQALHRADPGRSWTTWPQRLRWRDPAALAAATATHATEISYLKFQQFVFAQQWARLRLAARVRGIQLIGDIPIFVAHESADVWAHARYFQLDEAGEPARVAGVPPDYFSATGQRWGNPLYRWNRLRRDGYRWWIDRFTTQLERFDLVRLDHFIGFVRYWEIPASDPTAAHGRWMRGPGDDFFHQVRQALGRLPFIAEDLGSVTPAVRALRDAFGLPGMRVFQFAFDTHDDAAGFLPHSYLPNSVAYSGTHDNDTIVGWFEQPGPRTPARAADERAAAIEYLAGPGARHLHGPVHREVLRALYASGADTVIVPMQDVLGLGSDARMNLPGQAEGNWRWRVPAGALTDSVARQLRDLARVYHRGAASRTTR
ncbi:MAG: 4-alpha-glucanotransferase (amylomaltase) [Deltaproteobacteria bacterium]|nr:4-alpha-glucanotransferase (amylomaltase) [Deltaproteobacteria bacterium]